MELKNTGSADSTLNRVFINDVPIPQSNYGQVTWIVNSTSTDITYAGTTVTPGASLNMQVYVHEAYGTLSSGTTVNIKVHSAGGMDYIKLVELV